MLQVSLLDWKPLQGDQSQPPDTTPWPAVRAQAAAEQGEQACLDASAPRLMVPSPWGPAGTATCIHPDSPTLCAAGARGLSASLPFPPGLHQGQLGVLEQACSSPFVMTQLWKVSIKPSPLCMASFVFSSTTCLSAGGAHVWPDGCGVHMWAPPGCLHGIRTSLSPRWLGRAQHQ